MRTSLMISFSFTQPISENRLCNALIITFLLSFFFYKRKRNRKRRKTEIKKKKDIMKQKKNTKNCLWNTQITCVYSLQFVSLRKK